MSSRRRPSTSTVCPTIGRPPNAVCHNSCERIAMGGSGSAGCLGPGGGALTSVALSANKRPCAARTPRALSKCSSTNAARALRSIAGGEVHLTVV